MGLDTERVRFVIRQRPLTSIKRMFLELSLLAIVKRRFSQIAEREASTMLLYFISFQSLLKSSPCFYEKPSASRRRRKQGFHLSSKAEGFHLESPFLER